jgi:hypothetical protein
MERRRARFQHNVALTTLPVCISTPTLSSLANKKWPGHMNTQDEWSTRCNSEIRGKIYNCGREGMYNLWFDDREGCGSCSICVPKHHYTIRRFDFILALRGHFPWLLHSSSLQNDLIIFLPSSVAWIQVSVTLILVSSVFTWHVACCFKTGPNFSHLWPLSHMCNVLSRIRGWRD